MASWAWTCKRQALIVKSILNSKAPGKEVKELLEYLGLFFVIDLFNIKPHNTEKSLSTFSLNFN